MKPYKLNRISRYLDKRTARIFRDASNEANLAIVEKIINPPAISLIKDPSTGMSIGKLFSVVKSNVILDKVLEARKSITVFLKALADVRKRNDDVKKRVNAETVNKAMQELSKNLDPGSREAKASARSAAFRNAHGKSKIESPLGRVVNERGVPKIVPSAVTTNSIKNEMRRWADPQGRKVERTAGPTVEEIRKNIEEAKNRKYTVVKKPNPIKGLLTEYQQRSSNALGSGDPLTGKVHTTEKQIDKLNEIKKLIHGEIPANKYAELSKTINIVQGDLQRGSYKTAKRNFENVVGILKQNKLLLSGKNEDELSKEIRKRVNTINSGFNNSIW